VIARGLRHLAAGLLVLAGATALGSLLVGAAAGLPPQRAVSGGLILVGALLFTAGGVAGLRDPGRTAARGRPAPSDGPRTWAEALHLSALLVTAGVCLVLAGIALDPRTSL
jgi:hypothetical protein